MGMNLKMKIKTYSEMITFKTLEQRFRYLSLGGQVGDITFGFDRWMNQQFYRSAEWRHIRDQIVARDYGCDLGIEGHDIHERLQIHHMNPMTVEDLKDGNPDIIDPEFLITVRHRTHNAIHFGDESLLPKPPVIRKPGDTRLW